MLHPKFSRKFKTLLPINSDFTAYKLPNFLENFSAPSVLPPRNHPTLIDFRPLKLLEIKDLSFAKNFVTKIFAIDKVGQRTIPRFLVQTNLQFGCSEYKHL